MVKGFSIGEVVDQTGIAEATLRIWERRFGFPAPERLDSGHRRYSELDVELIRRVAAERARGVSLGAAIERSLGTAESPVSSVFAALRRRRPDLQPQTLSKRAMLALTHALEDESLARAERPLLFASFQRKHFYSQSRPRWRELSRGAELALAFADFDRVRTPRGAPAEIPVDRDQPLAREWALVCDAPGHAACVVGWEPPASATGSPAERHFETIWSVEPDVVREAARIFTTIAAAAVPDLVMPVRERLDATPPRPVEAQLRLATAVADRALRYLA